MLKGNINSQYPFVENDYKVIKSLYANESRLNAMANFYDHVTRFGSSQFEDVVDIIKNNANAIILDAGCGTGTFWNQAQKFGCIQSLFLLDQSPNLVECAYKKARETGINDVNGITADLDTFSLMIENKADIILSLQVYHHLHKVINTHNHLRQLLCNDGIIVATTCNHDHMYELYEQVAFFFNVIYEDGRGLKHFNGKHLISLDGLVESRDLIGTIQCSSVNIFINYVSSLAILDRFDLRGSDTAAEFMNYMKNWAEEKLTVNGIIEFHQSVKLAIFQA
jgi:SAM-dependent methyltransferase